MKIESRNVQAPVEISEAYSDSVEIPEAKTREVFPSGFERVMKQGLSVLLELRKKEPFKESNEDAIESLENAEYTAKLLYFLATVLIMNQHELEFDKLEQIASRYRGNIYVPFWEAAKDSKGRGRIDEAYRRSVLRRVQFLAACDRLNKEYALISSLEEAKEIINLLHKRKQEMLGKIETKTPSALKEYSSEWQTIIGSHCNSVTLNVGCSARCSFCALSPEKNVRDRMPFSQAAWLAKNLANTPEHATSFYEATDPGDYVDPDDPTKTYKSVVTVQSASSGFGSYVSTAIPHGSWDRLKAMSNDISRISISYSNVNRLKKMGIIEEVDGAIVVTDPDAADIIYHGGFHTMIQQANWLFSDKQNMTEESFLSRFVSTHKRHDGVNNLVTREVMQAGKQRTVAKSLDTYVEFGASIMCKQGVHITPERVLNYLPALSSERYPDGKIEVPISIERAHSGCLQMKELLSRLMSDEQVTVESILLCGMICPMFGQGNERENIAVTYVTNELNLTHSEISERGDTPFGKELSVLGLASYFVPEKEQKNDQFYISPDFRKNLATQREKKHPPFKPHFFAIDVYDENLTKSTWNCIYNLSDGKIFSLREVDAA